MKRIVSTRKDDLIRKRDEYKQRKAERAKLHDEQYSNFRNAQEDAMAPIHKELESNLSEYTGLKFDIKVDVPLTSMLRVYITCNERNKFDENSALSWSYECTLGSDGSIKKETSSWSGLKAVTPEQIDNLRQTVSALDYLCNVDWENLLNITLPEYQDFVDTEESRFVDPDAKRDFNKEIKLAAVEDHIGTGDILKGNTMNYVIHKQTDAFMTVSEIPNYYLNKDKTSIAKDRADLCREYTDRRKKDKILDDLVFDSNNDVIVIEEV